MRLNIGHSQCTEIMLMVIFFSSSSILLQTHPKRCTCVLSRPSIAKAFIKKSQLHKSDYNDCKYIIVIFIESSRRFFLRLSSSSSWMPSVEIFHMKSLRAMSLHKSDFFSKLKRRRSENEEVFISFYYFSWLFEFLVNWMMSLEKVKR